MNNLSVKRCREKKKQEHDALRAGYEKQEEDLKKAKTEIGILKATIKKLHAPVHAPAPANDDANKNLVTTNNSSNNNDACPHLLYLSHLRRTLCFFQVAEVCSLKAVLKEKDFEIASLKLERDCGFTEVNRLERALRPYKHHELEQTWGVVVRISILVYLNLNLLIQVYHFRPVTVNKRAGTGAVILSATRYYLTK